MDNFSKLCGHGKANPLSKLCSHQLTCCKKIREANLFSKLCGPHTLKEKGKSKPFEQTFWSLVYNTCCRKTREANPFSKLCGHQCTIHLQENKGSKAFQQTAWSPVHLRPTVLGLLQFSNKKNFCRIHFYNSNYDQSLACVFGFEFSRRRR